MRLDEMKMLFLFLALFFGFLLYRRGIYYQSVASKKNIPNVPNMRLYGPRQYGFLISLFFSDKYRHAFEDVEEYEKERIKKSMGSEYLILRLSMIV